MHSDDVQSLTLYWVTDISNKYWTCALHDTTVHISWNAIGKTPQGRLQTFRTRDEARCAYHGAICAKLVKGYKPRYSDYAHLLDNAAVQTAPRAIASAYIGEDVPQDVIEDLCMWLSTCLCHHLSPMRFARLWNKLCDDEMGGILTEALGRIRHVGVNAAPWDDETYWLDVTEWGEKDLSQLYREAVDSAADRVIWDNNNAYITLVVLRGDPGAAAIERCIYAEDRKTDWPPTCLEGVPIASMHDCGSFNEVVLRNGFVITGEEAACLDSSGT